MAENDGFKNFTKDYPYNHRKNYNSGTELLIWNACGGKTMFEICLDLVPFLQ